MSNTGVASGLYSQIREYAELLDLVLLDLKAGVPEEHREARLQLGELLAGSRDRAGGDMRMQLLASLLREPGHAEPARLVDIGRALLGQVATPALVGELETLAKTLEQERVWVFAKIRGQ